MSHAEKADKLLIKPAAGARPAPPRTRGQLIPQARTRRPVTRRVTRGTATTRLATAPDRPTPRVLPSPEHFNPDYRLVSEKSNYLTRHDACHEEAKGARERPACE
jgi:hypothetical protein